MQPILESPNARDAPRPTRPKGASLRDDWIAQQVSKGINVLITNPALVQMGLDLIDFPVIHCYQVHYSSYVQSQAVRRSLRPGQKVPVRVYYWYYKGTFEADALRLVSAKQRTDALVAGGDIAEQFYKQAGEVDLMTALAVKMRRGLEGLARRDSGR